MTRWMKKGLLSLAMFSFFIHADDNTESLINSINSTGCVLFHSLDQTQNSLISPLSIHTALLMAYVGSRGETAQEFKKALRLTLPLQVIGPTFSDMQEKLRSENIQIKMGNSMWVDEPIDVLFSYKHIINKNFKGSLNTVDFKKPLTAAQAINQWVVNHTDGKINQFISPLDLSSSTKMILISTLDVSGKWETPFLTQSTNTEIFFTQKNKSVKTPMMHQKALLPYFENQDTQILILPLKGSPKLGLAIFLPKQPQPHLFDFYYTSNKTPLKGTFPCLDLVENRYVDLTIPKFTASQKLNLTPLLDVLGVSSAQSNQANFSGINDKTDLKISQVSQQSFFSIDEEGILATASSEVTFSLKSSIKEDPPIKFIANHPFLYALFDLETHLLFFLGECLDPTLQNIQIKEEKNTL